MFIAIPIAQEIRLKPRQFVNYIKKKYQNPIKKVCYFIINEGITQTVRKVQSIRIANKIESEQDIIVAIFIVKSQRYVAVTRRIGDIPIFHHKLIFQISGDYQLKDVFLHENCIRYLEAYLPVEPCPFPEQLPSLILRDNPFLKEVTDISFLNKYIVSKSSKPSKFSNLIKPVTDNNNRVYLMGFGSYAQQYILHNFRKEVRAAVDFKADLYRKYMSNYFPIFNSIDDILGEITKDIEPLIIISTYHSTHTEIAIKVLQSNPSARVFIEKPISVRFEETKDLIKLRKKGAWIDIGFNRRYAGFTRRMAEEVASIPKPLVININVNELKLPETHWYFWKNQGTRVTGNLCHWIDLCYYFIQTPPIEINLLNTGDSLTLAMLYQDGSLASITASDLGGDKKGVQEYIEVRGSNITITNNDFKIFTVMNAYNKHHYSIYRSKGHDEMYKNLRKRWIERMPPTYPTMDMQWVSFITNTVSEMLCSKERNIKINHKTIF